MAPNWNVPDGTLRRDARFHPAERMRQKRSRKNQDSRPEDMRPKNR
jgi:type VI secretion system protein ImpH